MTTELEIELGAALVGGFSAPLLFVVRSSMAWPDDFFSRETANITVTIKEYAMNYASEEMHMRAWGAAFIIMMAVLTINVVARTVFRQKT